ncbi:MAG TPA: transglutaminase-like cysteine peptidase, partial [Sphingomicrobium sp.]|nr:transglutaminase-like cysteine peptidase [Sphingomicrobium sp.]
REIVWRSDATEWGRHDYWASASETLTRGAGDMEDHAILKMQALRALGFSASDLFLMMGKDKVAGPITVLVVRLDPRNYVMLEDLGGPPIAADRHTGFKPIMSFSGSNSWVHGRRVAEAGRAN